MKPEILDCGHPPSADAGCGTGYGVDDNGRRFCYACCADRDRTAMLEGRDPGLYLTGGTDGKPVEVTNWPGSLRFPVQSIRPTRIGFCHDGRIAYFRGPDGARWSARGPGMGMYARARRLKG